MTGVPIRYVPRTQDELRFWRCFPLRPLWSGFAINTIFYAAILWLLMFAMPGALRRHLRRRRGRCLNCGYDLRGDPATGCPECGWNREVADKAPET